MTIAANTRAYVDAAAKLMREPVASSFGGVGYMVFYGPTKRVTFTLNREANTYDAGPVTLNRA